MSVCNTKSVAITYVFLFSFLALFWMGWQEFLFMFHHSLIRKLVARIGFISLDTLVNVFVSVPFIIFS